MEPTRRRAPMSGARGPRACQASTVVDGTAVITGIQTPFTEKIHLPSW